MNRQWLALSAVGLAVFSQNCAPKKKGTFRLVPAAGGTLLVPPEVTGAVFSTATFSVPSGVSKAPCKSSLAGLSFGLKSHGRRKVTVAPGALLKVTSDELFSWAAAAETSACIPSGQGMELARAVVESTPLTPDRRNALLLPGINIGSSHSFRLVAPLYAKDATPPTMDIASVAAGQKPGSVDVEIKSSPGLLGYQVIWYDAIPRTDGAGIRIRFRAAEAHVDGKVNPIVPEATYLGFGAGQKWFRFFGFIRSSVNDFDFVVLSASNAAEMEQRTAEFRKDATAYLKSAAKGTYYILPKGIGINLYLRVTVDGVGKDVELLGASVRKALPAGTPTLIRLPYRGKLYPVQWTDAASILDLPLAGGEELTATTSH